MHNAKHTKNWPFPTDELAGFCESTSKKQTLPTDELAGYVLMNLRERRQCALTSLRDFSGKILTNLRENADELAGFSPIFPVWDAAHSSPDVVINLFSSKKRQNNKEHISAATPEPVRYTERGGQGDQRRPARPGSDSTLR